MATHFKMDSVNCLNCGNMSAYEDYLQDLNEESVSIMVPVILFMILLFIIGICGNALVIIVYCTKSRMSRANISMLGLAFVDFFSCLVIHPYVIYKLFHEFNQDWFVVCKVFEFFIHASQSVSCTLLVCIAYDRYRSICSPLEFYSGFPKFTRSVVGCVVVGFLGSVPVLKFYGLRSDLVTLENGQILTQKCDYSDEYQTSLSTVIYGAAAFIAFFISFLFITIMYWRLAAVVRKSKRIHPILTVSSSVTRQSSSQADNFQILSQISTTLQSKDSTSTENMLVFKNNGDVKNPKREVKQPVPVLNPIQTATLPNGLSPTKTAKMLFLVTLVFLLSWLPFWIVKFSAITGAFSDKKLGPLAVVQKFLTHLFFLNNAVNPIIYTGMNKKFCDDLKVLKRRIQRIFQ